MLLNGKELSGFIKERQAKDVRRLRARKIWPRLAIVQVGRDPVSASYVRSKQKYGRDIGVGVDIYNLNQAKLQPTLNQLSTDPKVHGIIVQLPLPKEVDTSEVLNSITQEKDVDGLGVASTFEKPTPTAILWLLAGYNVDLKAKEIFVVGQGRLVGEPLTKILKKGKYNVKTFNDRSKNLQNALASADIIITATGQPGLIKNDWVKPGAVVIDAGTAEAGGKVVGDADPKLYKRDDIKISPTPGGVGPLTVCALFDNVITAANGNTA